MNAHGSGASSARAAVCDDGRARSENEAGRDRGGAEFHLTRSEDHIPWCEEARCRAYDPEIFFPEKGESPRRAKHICSLCPVRLECLNYALRHDLRYGVWGGLSDRERRRLKRIAS